MHVKCIFRFFFILLQPLQSIYWLIIKNYDADFFCSFETKDHITIKLEFIWNILKSSASIGCAPSGLRAGFRYAAPCHGDCFPHSNLVCTFDLNFSFLIFQNTHNLTHGQWMYRSVQDVGIHFIKLIHMWNIV
jgi:hypothetical protein